MSPSLPAGPAPRKRPFRVDPLRDLGGRLLEVEKPARYLGGEYGARIKEGEGLYTVALCFPDLYEIGMSNNAIRILYEGLNRLDSLRCERVFAPAPDFEALLRELGLPLYTLETGIPLGEVDLIGFSLGYELAATSLLSVLGSGGVPLLAAERGEGDPLVISGGPAISNPHPFADFLDAAYIGEAEASFFALAAELADLKSSGAGRNELLSRLAQEPAIWMPSRPAEAGPKGKAARRAVHAGFAEAAYGTALPLPTVKTVQDHGTVEIMRGCPNGCRFCHAGYFYRPQRAKSFDEIRAEVEGLVSGGGYREITLSSLSSGDYPGIGELLGRLNAEYGPRRVSFQLPSLKISSFTLPILQKLAEIRKSGLTFAVETPVDSWQASINKDVSFEKTLAILAEARRAGFKQAKFYFMIGLPVPGRGMGEAKAIVDFFERLFARIQIQVNVNVGTFVPKPHTPYQWSAQLSEGESLEIIAFLRTELRRFRNLKLSYHAPFVSQLEGVIARGDERVGRLILEAYRRGARLDAWEERFDRELWRSVIESAAWDPIAACCAERKPSQALVWDDIGIRVSKASMLRELERSERGEFTSACAEDCKNPCGICGGELGVVKNSAQDEVVDLPAAQPQAESAPKHPAWRLLFRYSKKGPAAYLQHLSLVDALDRAFLMTGADVAYSEGFNPMPRLETAQPLPIAVESACEIASVLMYSALEPSVFIKAMNERLPRGLRLEEAALYPLREGRKQRTIGSLEWGSRYEILTEPELAAALAEKLGELLESRSVPDAQLEIDQGSGKIALRLRLPASKEQGLLRLLEECSPERPVQKAFRILRRELYASSEGNEPRSFFKAYELLS